MLITVVTACMLIVVAVLSYVQFLGLNKMGGSGSKSSRRQSSQLLRRTTNASARNGPWYHQRKTTNSSTINNNNDSQNPQQSSSTVKGTEGMECTSSATMECTSPSSPSSSSSSSSSSPSSSLPDTVNPSYLQHLASLDNIPKVVHITFTNATKLPGLVDDFPFLQHSIVGEVLNKTYNDQWTLRLWERHDMMELFNDAQRAGLMPPEEIELIQNAHIVELTDIARVVMMYMIGGIYIDLDRPVNRPLDEIIHSSSSDSGNDDSSHSTKMVLVTNKDHHFMQDIMISSPGNVLYREVLERMTQKRLYGGPNNGPMQRKGGYLSHRDLFQLGGPLYVQTVADVLFGLNDDTAGIDQRDIPAARSLIEESSNGLIWTGRHDFCKGALVQPFDGCEDLRRGDLYNHFNITNWARDAMARWDQTEQFDSLPSSSSKR